MPLSVADVERIAALAHLELTAAEKQLFTKQLADILDYAKQLQAVDTSGVAATAHVNATQRERDDEPRPSLPVADIVANAPDAIAATADGDGASTVSGLFRVPRVIG